MNQTTFYGPIAKGELLKLTLNGDIEASEIILLELERLENRIKQLELGVSVLVDKYSSNLYKMPAKSNQK